MSEISPKNYPQKNSNRRFFQHLARAFGGAILFSFPILMTMEMWALGFYMNGRRLALFTLLTVPLLIGLSYYDGFEPTSRFWEDAVDTFVAYAVGFVASAVMLYLFGVINFQLSANELIGKISVQAIVASIGAMFAQSLLSTGDERELEEIEERKREASYFGELFLMAVGAIFLSMSVAPTEEMNLISYKMSDWHTVALAVGTLLLTHAIVYAVEFRGHEKTVSAKSLPSVFLRYTTVGYAIALIISFYVLWTFGSLDGMPLAEQIKAAIVLAFPAAIGAAASRLLL